MPGTQNVKQAMADKLLAITNMHEKITVAHALSDASINVMWTTAELNC